MIATNYKPNSISQAVCSLVAALLVGCADNQDEDIPQSDSSNDFEPMLRQQIGDYLVMSSLTRSDALPLEMAERHGLPHSDEAAILNVVIQRDNRNVEADVDAQVSNLIEQTREVEMLETRANELVTYMGIVDIEPRSALTVELEILPVGEAEPIRLSYEHEFLPQTR